MSINNLRLPKDFRLRHVAAVSIVLVLAAALAEYTQSITQPSVLKSVILPAIGVVLVVLSLFPLSLVVLNRLLIVISGSTPARLQDLFLIGFTYVSFVVGYGIVYQLLESTVGKPVFAFSRFATSVRLFDNLYVSGITMATVGYGDITPTLWLTKLLVVSESLVGILLTATVLGFFIGSLLSSQQQDQQRRWYAGLQRRYLKALSEYSEAVNSIDVKLTAAELKKNTLNLRQGLLRTIASLVEAQYSPSPSAKVSANWMRFRIAADADQGQLDLAEQFTFPSLRGAGMKTLWGVLVLREWGKQPDNMPGTDELVLPVYDPEDSTKARNQLPGAPLAITDPDGYHIVPDTRSIDLDNQDPNVQEAMRRYFREHSAELRSFASVRVEHSDGLVGVVNIQSSEPDLCGTTEYVQRTIVDMIRPFAGYLARLALLDEAKQNEEAKNEN